MGEQLEAAVTEHVLARVQLDAAGAVVEVDEGGATVAAAGVDAPGYAIGAVGLLPGLEVGVLFVHARGRHHAVELMRKRLDAGGAEPLELCPAVVHAPER